MGGLIILLAWIAGILSLSAAVPWTRLTGLVLTAGLMYGAIGAADDLISLRRRQSAGLSAGGKLALSTLASVVLFFVFRDTILVPILVPFTQTSISLPPAAAFFLALAGNLLVAGDVNYSKRDDQPEPVAGDEESRGFAEFWPRLAATRLECQTILELHEGCFGGDGSSKGLYLSKSAATEERLKAEMGEFQIIHLATHGFFSPEGVPSLAEVAETTADSRRIQFKELRVGMESTPESKLENVLPGLLSSVVLSGANFPDPDREDDGLLIATETAWLDLEDCELVVLSACETSLGAVKVGEGMIGLRRAFRLAGAETVISSLWSVDDESTSDLMRKFYINIWRRRMSRGEALRQAQLSILREQRSTPGEAVRPYHWGAFVLDGDWR